MLSEGQKALEKALRSKSEADKAKIALNSIKDQMENDLKLKKQQNDTAWNNLIPDIELAFDLLKDKLSSHGFGVDTESRTMISGVDGARSLSLTNGEIHFSLIVLYLNGNIQFGSNGEFPDLEARTIAKPAADFFSNKFYAMAARAIQAHVDQG